MPILPSKGRLCLVTLLCDFLQGICRYCMCHATRMLIYDILTRVSLLMHDVAFKLASIRTQRERPHCFVELEQLQLLSYLVKNEGKESVAKTLPSTHRKGEKNTCPTLKVLQNFLLFSWRRVSKSEGVQLKRPLEYTLK